jgi:hypothetical protein
MLKFLLPFIITLTFFGCTDNAGTNSEPIVEAAPKLQSLTADVPEDIAAGRTIASINIISTGSGMIDKITLSGTGSEKFVVSTDGDIKLADSQTLDYETTRVYDLQAIATNYVGDSASVSVIINVEDVDEVAILKSFVGSIPENSPSDVAIGQVEVLSMGDSDITSMRLAGDGAENFKISLDGNISTDLNVSLDYEKVKVYNLTAYATNHGGESAGSDVTINILNVVDTPVILADTNITTPESATEGTVIGELNFITKGDSNITAITLSGEDADKFNVNNDGEVSVATDATLDYETKTLYTLNVVAEDELGLSNTAELNISITDVPDIVPTLRNATLSIDENSPPTAKVGDVLVKDSGDSEITSFALSGDGSSNFKISSLGAITVSDSAVLDYETQDSYDLSVTAKNSAGTSEPATVTINLINVENPFEVAKIQASDPQTEDHFSSTVAVYDQYIVIGAPDEDTTKTDAGAVYIYKKNTDETIDQIAKIQAEEPTESSHFGSSVAIYGDYIVVGAPHENIEGEEEGYSYLFKIDGSDVKQVTKFHADDAKDYDYFGTSVSISGEYIAVGAPNKDIDDEETKDNAGAAYVFKINSDDTVTQLDMIQSDNPEEDGYFGYSLAQDTNYTIVGAYGESNDAGNAYLFKLDSDDNVTLLKDLAADDKADGDNFGYSIDMSKNYIIVGAKGEDTSYSNAGSSYLFKIITDSDISQVDKLQASDPKEDNAFGNSVSIDNNYLVIGAYHDNHIAINEGSAYLFKINNDDSTQEIKKLQAVYGDANDYFATSVAISKENIIIGANHEDTTAIDAGAAYLFDIEPVDKPYIYNVLKLKRYNEEYSYKFVQTIDARRPNGGTIIYDVSGEDADQFDVDENNIYFKTPANYEDPQDDNGDNDYDITIVASNEFGNSDTKNTVIEVQDLAYLNMKKIDAKYPHDGDLYGNSVSISGDYIVTGSPKNDETASNAGSAYLYKKHDNGVITQIAQFQSNDPQEDDYFASSVALDGDYIVVGVPNEDINGTDAGGVYIFKRLSDDEDDVKQLTRLYASNASDGDLFGTSVAIDGQYITVGAPMNDATKDNAGSAYLFKMESDDNITQIATFQSDDADTNDTLGTTISIDGDYIVVGAYGNDDNGTNSGSAYLFKRNSDDKDDVNQTAKMLADDADTGDEFGNAVSISGNYIAIGASLVDTDDKNDTGTAYLFKRNSDDDVDQIKEMQPSLFIEYDHFGSSISIDGNNIAIGATGCDTKNNDDTTVFDSGCAYIFQRVTDTNIKEISKVQARDPLHNNNFGNAISINGDLFIVGANDENKTSPNTGSTTLFIKD